MKIGTFKLDEKTNEITGSIYTRALHLPFIILRAVELRADEMQSDRAPVFEIFEPSPAGVDIQIGAVWHRKMRNSEDTFLSGMIDDPSFAEPLPIALFGDELKGFDVQWRREREQQPAYRNGMGGNAGGYAQRRGSQQQSSGGFRGGSTAGANGEYTGGMTRSLDDEVPF
ncbi:hypothetical protein GCM10007897_24360 [Sphingobium jiangsuense]|uniref:Uncharacterized protein (DUF736 family) n=1 Tax=Sphingobium jiangsuense TaxID=870476 RepID=A0A7W6FSZ2_9SPHN|nr:DUF736 domain-containing protein [Sphingobium jiangsuense]MBB3928589.1 uncharacterized protein (DUF736 family) [Sphingobium jiangsuense]GLT01045.1 hypothetical protein GCM10007897_24360 [Sphingobium jiangsuense]